MNMEQVDLYYIFTVKIFCMDFTRRAQINKKYEVS
jgi:hypothetical protein